MRSAKNIKYDNGTLCADLRRSHRYATNDWNNYVEKYFYEESCIYANETTKLINDNGKFKIDNNTQTYSHYMTYPKGSWQQLSVTRRKYFDKSIIEMETTYFPNTVCAYFLVNIDKVYLKALRMFHTIYHYNEDCIEYNSSDYLTVKNGKFVLNP